MKDYRVTVKVRNNRLLKAIEESGGVTGQKWCDENGLRYGIVNNLINMTASPLSAKGTLSPEANRLCEVLNKLPEDLWSSEQLYPLEKNFSEMEMDYSQISDLMIGGQPAYIEDFTELQQEQTKKLLSDVLSTLTQREREIIRMRYEDEISYSDIAKHFEVTVPRIRQIEDKAMRKLRSPARAGILIDAMDFDVDAQDRAKYQKAVAEYRAGHV